MSCQGSRLHPHLVTPGPVLLLGSPPWPHPEDSLGLPLLSPLTVPRKTEEQAGVSTI